MKTRYRVLSWLVAIGLVFVLVSGCAIMWLAAGEELCLDRKPWWGPPTSTSDPDCTGHMNQRLEEGFGFLKALFWPFWAYMGYRLMETVEMLKEFWPFRR
jgi:hypothetical protein